jgi:hypothetical protein
MYQQNLAMTNIYGKKHALFLRPHDDPTGHALADHHRFPEYGHHHRSVGVTAHDPKGYPGQDPHGGNCMPEVSPAFDSHHLYRTGVPDGSE